jgi:S-adenosylmethionine decarboxylase
MRDLAPGIFRQRLLIEGYFTAQVDRSAVERYLTGLASALELRTYGPAIVHDPAGLGKAENQGFDAFIPLIDSGISLYVWSQPRFFAAVLFTCKRFDVARALDFTRKYFGAAEVEHREF